MGTDKFQTHGSFLGRSHKVTPTKENAFGIVHGAFDEDKIRDRVDGVEEGLEVSCTGGRLEMRADCGDLGYFVRNKLQFDDTVNYVSIKTAWSRGYCIRTGLSRKTAG
jgi:hypothetical protein